MNLWKSVDFTNTIKSYEYTRYTKYQIYHTVESDDFKEMNSRTIFEFLSNKMEIVPFNEYLRRFLFTRNGGGMEPCMELSEEDYINMIRNSFVDHAAPYCFSPTKNKFRTAIKNWLKSESARRNTIFILGFGLGMEDHEVEEFLTKVIKEESFDFGNPEEVIYWFCYHNSLPYSTAKELIAYYDQVECLEDGNQSLWEAMVHDPKMYAHSEKELKVYLQYLKTFLTTDDTIFEEFNKLYRKVQELIVEIYRDSDLVDNRQTEHNIEEINPAVVESVLYNEVPTVGGNMAKMSLSLLSKQFQNKRMNRQHISRVLKKKAKPDRYDLITMLFFLYANSIEYNYDDDPEHEGNTLRFLDYMDEINEILQRCNMAGIYPVNPYEAFLLMCLVSEDPLGSYYDVWRLSYGGDI